MRCLLESVQEKKERKSSLMRRSIKRLLESSGAYDALYSKLGTVVGNYIVTFVISPVVGDYSIGKWKVDPTPKSSGAPPPISPPSYINTVQTTLSLRAAKVDP
jgi:hypothetical protein